MTVHALSLLFDATTISLSTGNNLLLDYVPRTPGTGDLDVTESATVHVAAASSAALQTAVQALEDFFVKSKRRQKSGTGAKGYVQLSVAGATTHRSEVLDGRLTLGDDSLRLWGNTSVEVLLTWTRRFFWEDPTLTAIGLKNTGTSKTTSGVLVYNHHDSTSHENFVDIEGADIAGSIPAPVKVTMTAGGTLPTRRFYLTANTFHTPVSWQGIYEGESSTGSGTVTVDANSSGGNYMARTWTTSISHTTNAFIWAVSATQLGYAAGGWFRVLMRTATDPPANCYVKLKIKFDATTPLTTLWEGPEILLQSNEMHDLGAVQLPPGYVTGSPTALALILSVRNAATAQLDVDFIQIDGPDGVHRFDQQGSQLVSGDSVIDDGQNEAVYVQTAGGFTEHIFSDYPPPLLVWPGRDTRIRLLHNDAYGNLPIVKTMTMYAQYRPRRLTV